MPLSHCLDTCSLEVGGMTPSTVLFQDCFGYSKPFVNPYDSSDLLINLYKKTCWNYDWDWIEAIDQFWENGLLNNIESSNSGLIFPIICCKYIK